MTKHAETPPDEVDSTKAAAATCSACSATLREPGHYCSDPYWKLPSVNAQNHTPEVASPEPPRCETSDTQGRRCIHVGCHPGPCEYRDELETLSDEVALMVITRADAEWRRRNPPKSDPTGLTQERRIAFKEGFVAGWIARSLEVTEP